MNSIYPPKIWLEKEADFNLYGYVPMIAPCIVMIVLFGILTVAHSIQTILYRQWWTVILPIGTLAEVGGYIPRLIGHSKTRLRDPYVATMCLLIITPCLFAAVHFTILGRVATLFPRKYSAIRPIFVMPVFVTIDVVSLVIQGVGAGTAGGSDSASDAQIGSHIAVAGVAIQLFGYVMFMLLFLYFSYLQYRDPAPGIEQFKWLMIGVFCSSMLIILRSVYRVVELAMGFDGVINTTEWVLYAFDGAFVFVAVAILNIFHPGKYLPKDFSWKYNPEAYARPDDEKGIHEDAEAKNDIFDNAIAPPIDEKKIHAEDTQPHAGQEDP